MIDVNYKLTVACKDGDLLTVKECINGWANIHAYDDLALRWAAQCGHLEIVKYLVEQGADIHADNDYALQWAKERGHSDVVEYLESVAEKEKRRNKVDINDKLVIACKNGYLSTAKECIKQGANVNAYDGLALRWAAENGHSNVVEYLESIIEKEKAPVSKADINSKLIEACKGGDLSATKECIKQGANVRVWSDYALQWAAGKGHLEVVEYLVGQGANIHARSDEALRWSALYGHLAIVEYLVEQGADVHARNDMALRWAAENGHSNVVEYLESIIKKEKAPVSKPHTMILDGKEIQLSEEGYTKLRQNLLDYM